MTDLSGYTHKWRATPANSHLNDGSKVVKRNRQPVSCAPCRSRKLKCDRRHPCDACSKRSDEDSCVYGKMAASTTQRHEEVKQTMKAQERLRHLEELVKQMINPDKHVPTPVTPPTDDQRQPEGSLSKDESGTSYTGSTHWATVLDQIQELRNTLAPTGNTEDENCIQSAGGRIDSLFAAPQPPSLPVLLQKYLPPREDCDRYLSTYFNAKYVTIPFIHTSQFKRQYEKFWDNQLDTSPIWISILFAIMCVADGIRQAPLSLYGSGTEISKQGILFLTASSQCLVLGNYVKPQPFIIEALAVHCQCKYAISLDPSHELGMIYSILVRLAYTMGYHREPSMFEHQFTPFEGEMRRRVWLLLNPFDIMVSFQLGLPSIIQPDSADIQPPSHLLDEDFDEDTKVLPPARPDSEPTQILYLITKTCLMATYSKICQHTLSFPKQPFTEADIISLDTAITQAIDSIPFSLRAKPVSECYADLTFLTMIRSNLMFLGEKARCVLHRKYMVSGPNTDISRARCIHSSVRTISHFLDLHAEMQPGGQMFNDRYMLSSFTINDFLLALMVCCLAFSLGRKRYLANGGIAKQWLEQDQESMRLFNLLDKAQPVCASYGGRAKEAKHVAEAVRVVLAKMKPGSSYTTDMRDNTSGLTGQSGQRQNGNLTTSPNDAVGQNNGRMPLDIVPLSIHEDEALMTGLDYSQRQPINLAPNSSVDPGLLSSGQLLAYTNPMDESPMSSWDLVDNPLSSMLEGPDQIDWVQFDQFLWTYGVQSGAADDGSLLE